LTGVIKKSIIWNLGALDLKKYKEVKFVMIWMLLVLLYGVLKGFREVVKKKSLEKSTVMEVLFLYTLLGFLMVVPTYKSVMGLTGKQYLYVAIKSFIIFLAWILSFEAIKTMPISLYGILDLSRVLFATLLGTVVLGEVLNIFQITGLIFVSAGLLMLKYRPKKLYRFLEEKSSQGRMDDADIEIIWIEEDTSSEANINCKNTAVDDKKEHVSTGIVVIAFISCLLNAVSGLMDKMLMKDMTSSQLQFWYMLFMVLMYLGYILVTGTKIRWKEMWKNYWIWILSILFVIADKALFIANGMDGSRLTIMTLIKQAGCVITIIAGKYLYHEKNIAYKAICTVIIIAGIVIAVL